MAFVSPWIGQERPVPEDEMAVRVQERIAFRNRYGLIVSGLSLGLQVYDEADDEGKVAAADVLAGFARALLKEWRQP